MKSVFVSSTFRDMQAERDVLAMKVIPELNVYAREFGQSIRFVDLRWGVNTTDLDSDEGSQKVLKVCLDEIDNTRPYMIILIGERYGWIPPGEMIKSAADRKGYALQDFEKSVTELEIEYGALAEKGQLQNCLFYFRNPLLNIPENARDIYIEKDEKIENKLQALKQKIINSGAVIKEYSCEWEQLNNKLIVPESFEKNVFDDVISLFERDFERLKNLAPQQREELSAQLFADQKAAQFAARYDLLDSYIEQIKNNDTSLFILRGDPGSGKSTMMAKLFKTLSEGNNAFLFASGNSSFSQNALDILEQIVFKIESLLNINVHFGGGENLTLENWKNRFSELAELYSNSSNNNLFIFCDALDQLTKNEIRDDFSWLPEHLPKNIKIICSMLQTLEMPAFYPLQNNCKIEILKPLKPLEIPQIINSIINSNGKELPENIINKLSVLPGSENPLYLSMAVQRLMMLDSEDFKSIAAGGNDMNAINSFMFDLIKSFPHTPQDMARYVLKEAGERIDSEFCDTVGALLATSRRGLRETDLQEIFKNEGIRFSTVDLSLFIKYMQNFFMQREDGRLDFTHRVIREGLLENIDFEKNNLIIFNHLKTLNKKDAIKINEIIFHAYKADDKNFIAEYIEDYEDVYEAANANELRDICLADTEWIIDLVDFAIVEKQCLWFPNFINADFASSFEPSLSEYKVLERILPAFIEASEALYQKLPSALRMQILSHSYGRTGATYQTLGDFETSLIYYKKHLEMQETYASQEKTITAYSALIKAYYSVGDICNNQSNQSEAFDMYDIGLNYARQIIGMVKNQEVLRDASIGYDRVADIYKARKQYGDALEMYKKSLEIRKELLEAKKSTGNYIDLGVSYDKLGELYQMLDDFESAIRCYKSGLEINERLIEQEKTPIVFRDYSVSLERMGDVSALQGNCEDALEFYFRSLEVRNQLYLQLHTHSTLMDLASIYNRIGNMYQAQKQYEDAIAFHKKSLEASEQFYETVKTLEAYRYLAVNYHQLGSVYHAQQNYMAAIEALNSALKIREQLTEHFKTATAIRDLMFSNFLIAESYREINNLGKALEHFFSSERMAKYLAEQLKTVSSFMDLRAVFINIEDLFGRLGDEDEQQRYYRMVEEIQEIIDQAN